MIPGTSVYVFVCYSACTTCPVTVINEFVFGVQKCSRGCWDWVPILMRSLTWDETRTTATLLPLSLFSLCLTSFLPSSLYCSLSFRPTTIVLSFPSHSTVLSLDDSSQFYKGKTRPPLFSIISPYKVSDSAMRCLKQGFQDLKANLRPRLTLEHGDIGCGAGLPMLFLSGWSHQSSLAYLFVCGRVGIELVIRVFIQGGLSSPSSSEASFYLKVMFCSLNPSYVEKWIGPNTWTHMAYNTHFKSNAVHDTWSAPLGVRAVLAASAGREE